MASEQVSQAVPTIDEVESWDESRLLGWIKQRYPRLLRDDDMKKLTNERVDGNAFLSCAGNTDFFNSRCGLAAGTSLTLADLASELMGEETPRVKMKRKRLSETSESSVSPDLGASLIITSSVSLRVNTVMKLAELLDNDRVVHVRGTPATGKTTLAYLLRKYYKDRGDRVVLITRPKEPSNERLSSYLTKECKMEGYFGVDLNVDNIIFIIDEAQVAYTYGELWEYMKAKRDQHKGPRFCIFTVYGSPSRGWRETTDPTPDVLCSATQVSILCSHRKNPLNICLFYDEAEFADVLHKYCSNPLHELPLQPDARKYLYSITSGHPGAIASILLYLTTAYGVLVKKGVIKSITMDNLVELLDDDAAVFASLTQSAFPVHRSFPLQEKLSTKTIEVFKMILCNGSIPFETNNEEMKLCFKQGWIHVDPRDKESSSDVDSTATESLSDVDSTAKESSSDVDSTDQGPVSLFCFLPSRLHEKYIEYYITSMKPRPFPYNKFPNLHELCKAILAGFSKKSLLLSSTERGRELPIPARRTLESQYQDEFYRVFAFKVGIGAGISSEWSRSKESSSSTSGRIDFRISGPKWGVELLRNGTQATLNEHYKRFLPKGRYHKWIRDELITEWLVIDCRCSTPPEGYSSPGPNLWYAVFAEDYSDLRILDADKQEIMSVPLMNEHRWEEYRF